MLEGTLKKPDEEKTTVHELMLEAKKQQATAE